MLVDTHAHYMMDKFSEDLDQVILRAKEAGIGAVINIGTDITTSKQAIAQSEVYDFMFAASGIHPHEVSNVEVNDWDVLTSLLNHPKNVALGEIGLDYYYDFAPKEIQKQLFEKQLKLAKDLNLPVIIHSRDAMQDTLNVIDSVSDALWKGVFHCFGGNKEDALKVLARGFHISFTGVITFKNFKETDAVLSVPFNKLMLETDAPYMTPIPHRGKRNESMYIPLIRDFLAELHSVSKQEIEDVTSENAKALFNLQI